MRKGRRLLPLAAFLLATSSLLGGCQSVSSYFQDRVLDFVDIFGFKIVAGKGCKAGIEIGNSFLATEYEDFFFSPITPGIRRHLLPPNPVFGYYDFEKFGFQSRACGIWRDKGIDLFGPVDRKLRAIAGNDYIYESVDEFNEWYRKNPERTSVPLDYRQPKYHEILDIHCYLALFFGIEFDFSPWQLADFLLGWFHIDICKDDAWNRFYNEEEDVQPAPPPIQQKREKPSTLETSSGS
ncbi:hypothetical protein HY251_12275 [bacterium]|nr:hypothetical protein [bacterium]